MHKALLAIVCLVIGCQGIVESSGAGGEAGGASTGTAPPLVLCEPMVPTAPDMKCYGMTQCDDNDPCTADRCAPDGTCCHSVIGNCN